MSENTENFKAPRPFLRKGQGTARFMKKNEKDNHQTNVMRLPRFTPTNSSVPQSARTDFDSGISNEGGSPFGDNEDETRPPTMASLPFDSSPLEGTSRQGSSSLRNQPIVVEEQFYDPGPQQDNQQQENDQEIESISALQPADRSVPTFVADSAAESTNSASISTNCSALSEEERRQREEAKQAGERALRFQSLASVSPISTSSMSTPLGASTPINADAGQQFRNRFHEESSHPFSQEISSVTPQGRHFVTNRNNLRDDDAQTGASLLQGQQNQRRNLNQQMPSLRQRTLLTNQQQNINRQKVAQHVYDQPLPRNHGYPDNIERNLVIQLRDAIAHVDFADLQLTKTGKKMEENYKKLTNRLQEKHEKQSKDMADEYSKKFELLEEEKRVEAEKNMRDRRDIERDRRILQKEAGERTKEHLKLIEELRTKLGNSETQLAKLRLDVRTKDEKLKKKDEELEKLGKEMERLKKNHSVMEKRLRQIRNENKEKDNELDMFVKTAMNRGNGRVQQNEVQVVQQKLPLKPAIRESKNVHWAVSEKAVEKQKNIAEEWTMKPVENANTEWGRCTLFRNALGHFTSKIETAGNSTLYEYMDGTKLWTNMQRTLEIQMFPGNSVLQIHLIRSNICLRFYQNRQLEIWRPDEMVSLVSYQRNQIRTEVMRQGNVYYTELFDREGNVVTKDMIQGDGIQRYLPGGKYSQRDNGSRYVNVVTLDDFEFIEPEFRLRWYQGHQIVVKVFLRKLDNSKDLRFEITPQTNETKVDVIEDYSPISRISQKKTLFILPAARSHSL